MCLLFSDNCLFQYFGEFYCFFLVCKSLLQTEYTSLVHIDNNISNLLLRLFYKRLYSLLFINYEYCVPSQSFEFFNRAWFFIHLRCLILTSTRAVRRLIFTLY